MDQGSPLLLHGAHRLPLFVSVLLLGGQIVHRAHYLLVHRLARLVQGGLDYVPRLVHRSLNGLARLLIGILAQEMHARDEPSRRPTDLPDRLPDPLNRPSYETSLLRCLSPFRVLFLPSHLFFSSFLRLLGRLSCNVVVFLGLPSCILSSLRVFTHRFLGFFLVCRLPHVLLLGLLGYLVDHVFYTVLLGELVEGVL